MFTNVRNHLYHYGVLIACICNNIIIIYPYGRHVTEGKTFIQLDYRFEESGDSYYSTKLRYVLYFHGIKYSIDSEFDVPSDNNAILELSMLLNRKHGAISYTNFYEEEITKEEIWKFNDLCVDNLSKGKSDNGLHIYGNTVIDKCEFIYEDTYTGCVTIPGDVLTRTINNLMIKFISYNSMIKKSSTENQGIN